MWLGDTQQFGIAIVVYAMAVLVWFASTTTVMSSYPFVKIRL
jgi:hypothetical protein